MFCEWILKQWTPLKNGRLMSTNGQLQWIIAEALRKSGRLKKKSSKTGNKPEESEGEQVED